MLTDEGDIVLDIFGGSNTTEFTAEAPRRKWMTFEFKKKSRWLNLKGKKNYLLSVLRLYST